MAYLHYNVTDSDRSVVLEWIDGKVQITENTLGVLTNEPTFDFHRKNISTYVSINGNINYDKT